LERLKTDKLNSAPNSWEWDPFKSLDYDNVYQFILNEIRYLDRLSKIENNNNPPKPEPNIGGAKTEKIKWLGTPSLFGYLFLELVKHGFIEPPLYNGDPNYTGFARLCFQYFDIDTTPGNLIKEMNPEKNTLSDTKRLKFPDLSELA